MKKRCILLAVLLAGLLAGCSETEPAACQHQWTDANCIAPKTCTLCAATEGDALPHRYDNWLKDPVEDQMIQYCLECGGENGPVRYDREQYLLDYACGVWASADEAHMDILTLKRDMTFDLNDNTQGTWSYRLVEEVTPDQQRNWYMRIMLNRDGRDPVGDLHLSVGSGPVDEAFCVEDVLQLHRSMKYDMNEDTWMLTSVLTDMTKFGAEATRQIWEHAHEQLLGHWQFIYSYETAPEEGTAQDSGTYSVVFREDGTFCAVLEQEYIGTWRLYSVYADGIYYALELEEADGADVCFLSASIVHDSGALRIFEEVINENTCCKQYFFARESSIIPGDNAVQK